MSGRDLGIRTLPMSVRLRRESQTPRIYPRTVTETNARDRLIQQVWRVVRNIDEATVHAYPSAARAIQAGAAPPDLVAAMTVASYETAYRLLFLLSAEHAEEGNTEAHTGWVLAEASLAESGDAVPNGNRSLDFLHEDLLDADPTGREGRDLFT